MSEGCVSGEIDDEGHSVHYFIFCLCVCIFPLSDSPLNNLLLLVLQCKGMCACGEFLWLEAGMYMTFTVLLSHDKSHLDPACVSALM